MDKKELITNSLAVLIGDYPAIRKHACLLILRMLLPTIVLEALLAETEVYPFERKDNRVMLWRKTVLDAEVCAHCCGIDDLEAHHIHSWADFPLERVDPQNGLCLCHDCHTEAHRSDERTYRLMVAAGGGVRG